MKMLHLFGQILLFSCKFYIFLSVNLNFLCKMILFSVTLASTVFTCRLVRLGSLRDYMLVKTLINTYILVCNFHSPWIWDTSVCICIHCHMGHMALHTIISANLRTEWSFPTCIWQVHECDITWVWSFINIQGNF